jgi:16S rRNA (guanine527-N7)-methyltransferase
MVLMHYVDSAMVAQTTDLPSPLLDMGTGAGLPGIPIKIMRPDLELILAESRHKKLEFLEEAIQILGLEGVELYPHKVTGRFEGRIKGVITRDLETMSKTLERAAGFIPRNGRVIFMKGPAADSEIEIALDEFGRNFEIKEDHAYRLGQSPQRRRLVIFERVAGSAFALEPESPESTGDFGPGAGLPVREIASSQNAKYKLWTKLLDGRQIKKHGLAVFSGPKQVAEIFRDFPERCETVLIGERDEPPADAPIGIDVFRLRPELFRELDLFGAGSPLVVVRVPDLPAWDESSSPEGCTLFLPFQDPANLGAAVRSAAAFGVTSIVLLAEAAHPFHPRSLRAAGPTVFRVSLAVGPSIRDLRPERLPLIALSAKGQDVAGFEFPKSFGLLPGLEGPGLPEDLPRTLELAIPMEPGVESLNAATAAAIVLYQWKMSK